MKQYSEQFCEFLLLCLTATLFVCYSKGCTGGSLRLVGGPNEFEGRLEYCNGSSWGHVCGSGWGQSDANVVCRQLGFETPGGVILSLNSRVMYYGAQDGPAFINNIDCTGSEATLESCTKQEIDETGCSSLGGFVYLLCSDPACAENERSSVRLVGGESDSSGKVEVCDIGNRRRQVCQNGWGDQDAMVICRSLGFQNGTGAVSLSEFEVTTARLPVYNSVECTGTEEDIAQCPSSTLNIFSSNSCPGFAGVMCSDPPPSSLPSPPTSSPSQSRSSTASQGPPSSTLVLQSSPTPTSVSSPLNTAGNVVTPTVVPSPPGASAADNTLLITVVGSVGGAVVVLLLLLVFLFVLILLKRNKSSDRYEVSSPEKKTNAATPATVHNGNGHLPPIPLEDFENSLKREFEPRHKRPRSSSDYDHVLLNPLYGPKSRSRSNTITSDRSSISTEDPGYSEIKKLVRKRSPLQNVLHDGSSIPSDTSGSSHTSYAQGGLWLRSNSDTQTQPYLDQAGYAELDGEQHVYDEMTTHMYDGANQLSKSMRNNIVPINELLLSASPYETPAIPASSSATGVLRGSLLSPTHKFGAARSNPNLSVTKQQRGFTLPLQKNQLSVTGSTPDIYSHPEYRELEMNNHWYDSPRRARGYEAPMVTTNKEVVARTYEDPILTKDVSATGRGYENPVITVTPEGKQEQTDKGVYLDTIPEYGTLDPM